MPKKEKYLLYLLSRGDKVVLQIFFFFLFFSFYYYYYSFLRSDHESENTWGNMNFLFMFGF